MNEPDIVSLDTADPLAAKRDDFDLPEDKIYLDGNSLGPLSHRARQRAQEVIDKQWGQDLIASWNKHHWIDLSITVGAKISPLLGASPEQVVCCDSVSINLFKLLSCALQLQTDRSAIVSAQDNFPTDLYIAGGLSQLLGEDRCKLRLVNEAGLERALDDDPAVLLLSHVNFRTGRLHDMQSLTRAAHQRGCLVIWDVSHSAGVVPIELDEWQVDFAVGCGYKYLNGGPGAPAFLYVAKRHLANVSQPLQGWMGHHAPFDFEPSYKACDGIGQFLSGTPPIISLSVLDAAMDVFADVSMEMVRAKSIQLSELFIDLIKQNQSLAELELRSPTISDDRGSQLAYAHPSAYAICQALITAGIVADFRSPDLLRFGFSPLILSFEDILHSVQCLASIVAEKRYLEQDFEQRLRVRVT